MAFASRLKQLASETAIYGASSILGRMIGYLLVPFYTWYFEPHRYGVVLAIYAAFVFLNVLYTYGMEAAYLTFASKAKEKANVQEIFSTATWLLLGSTAIFSLLLVVLKDEVGLLINIEGQWTYLLYYAAGILFFDTMAVVPFADLRLQNRPWRFAVVRLAGIFTNIGLNIGLIVGLGWGISAVLLSNVISSGLVVLLLMPVYTDRLRWTFKPELQKQLLRFGLPFLPSGLGFAMTEVVNRTYIGRMSGERVLDLYGSSINLEATALETAEGIYGQHMMGVFGAALKIGVAMMLVAQMFRFAWQPFFLKHAEDADAKPLFARVFTLFTAAELSIFLAVSFFADELVALPVPNVGYFIEPSYWLGLHVVPLILLAYLFQGWYYVFSAGLYITQKTIYFIHCTVLGAAVTLVLNIWLVPYYGMAAAAWATVAAYMVMALSLLFITQRFYPIQYAWKRIGMMGLLAGGTFFAWYLVKPLQTWWWELLLLGGFAGGLLALRIVPLQTLRQVMRRSSAS